MLREIYGEYTDKIESYGCDEAWLDVSDSISLKGDGRKIADEISSRVKKGLGITVSADSLRHGFVFSIHLMRTDN